MRKQLTQVGRKPAPVGKGDVLGVQTPNNQIRNDAPYHSGKEPFLEIVTVDGIESSISPIISILSFSMKLLTRKMPNNPNNLKLRHMW